MSSRTEQFRRALEREHATTRKVLHAFDAAQAEFKPSEKSSSAKRLAWTFVAEERMMLKALKGEDILGGGFAQPPERWDELLAALDAQHAELDAALRSADDAAMDGTVKFMVAPKQVGDYRTSDFLWFLLHDQIHHRGQLSVYVRMTGGALPSIYGPTADEPWI